MKSLRLLRRGNVAARFFCIVGGVQCLFYLQYRAVRSMHSFPRIIHQMHANETSVDPRNRPLMEQCRAINHEFKYKFWSDEAADALVKNRMPKEVYARWVALDPPMKKVDSFRYILMWIYGGVYIDNDVECSQRHPLREWVSRIPYGAGSSGGYPEPMQLASWPHNQFWVFMLESVFNRTSGNDVWQTSGPAGLHETLVQWGHLHGRNVFLQFDGQYSWFYPLKNFEETRKRTIHKSLTFTFIPNELVDPAACSEAVLKPCVDSFCESKFPNAYLIHHCRGLWRGTSLGQS